MDNNLLLKQLEIYNNIIKCYYIDDEKTIINPGIELLVNVLSDSLEYYKDIIVSGTKDEFDFYSGKREMCGDLISYFNIDFLLEERKKIIEKIQQNKQ